MSYLAIYRRFRPKTFDEVIGQEHIVRTLTNQITSGRIGHAYLFCGTRGTGKTTTAKIFARAINCEHPVNGSPCGTCETCRALSDPANLDILEMDAASNNKVENVREIRDKVQYPPVAGKYKVYIIDEVHMLTTEAFNALLKTLEEPPSHAVFILATTEQHKLPATILSRCMRFDFKLVPDEKIVALIEKIYDEVGKEYDKEAVVKIARSGEGCVRDALSIADLCLSFSDKKLTYNDVIDVLGASDNKNTYQLLDGIFSSDKDKAMSVTEMLCASGKSVGLMCKDVQCVLKDVLVVKTCRNYQSIIALPESELKEIKALADKVDEHRMLRILEIFSAIENDLKYSTHPRIVFETAVLKATLPDEDYNVDALIGRIARLETKIKELEENGIKVPVSVGYQPVSQVEEQQAATDKPIETKPTEQAFKAAEPAAATEEEVEEGPAPAVAEPTEPDTAPTDMGAEIDGFFAEEGFPEPPPEDDYAQPAFEERPAKAPLAAPVTEKPEQPAARETSKIEAPAMGDGQAVSAVRVWGKVIRKLRADKNIMLWIACQDAEAKAIGGKLVVSVDGDNEYNLLTKPESLSVLQGIVSAECALTVVITKRGAPVDTFEDDINTVKEVLGDVEVVD